MHLLVLCNSGHTANVLVSIVEPACLLGDFVHASKRGANHEDCGRGPTTGTQSRQVKDARSTSPRVEVEASRTPKRATLQDFTIGAFRVQERDHVLTALVLVQ